MDFVPVRSAEDYRLRGEEIVALLDEPMANRSAPATIRADNDPE